MTETIYNATGIAELLGVTRQTVLNYQKTYDDTPEPDYATSHSTSNSVGYWSTDSANKWLWWHAELQRNFPRQWSPRTVKDRKAKAAARKAIMAELLPNKKRPRKKQ